MVKQNLLISLNDEAQQYEQQLDLWPLTKGRNELNWLVSFFILLLLLYFNIEYHSFIHSFIETTYVVVVENINLVSLPLKLSQSFSFRAFAPMLSCLAIYLARSVQFAGNWFMSEMVNHVRL